MAVKERKKGGSSGIKVGFGSTGSTYIPMLVGYVFGFIGDIAYNMVGAPGYDSKVGNCAAFSWGDIYQVAGLTGLTFLAFVMKSWSVATFSFGAMAGSLTPKVFAATNILPRYGLFNIDPKTGSIAPSVGTLRDVYPVVDKVDNSIAKVLPVPKKQTTTNPPTKSNLGISVSYL